MPDDIAGSSGSADRGQRPDGAVRHDAILHIRVGGNKRLDLLHAGALEHEQPAIHRFNQSARQNELPLLVLQASRPQAHQSLVGIRCSWPLWHRCPAHDAECSRILLAGVGRDRDLTGLRAHPLLDGGQVAIPVGPPLLHDVWNVLENAFEQRQPYLPYFEGL